MDGLFRPAQSLRRHAIETIRLAAPLAAAQLAQMAMGITDTILLGSLGAEALAAGGLATALVITVFIILQGVQTALSILVAQGRGAGQDGTVPGLYWTGILLTVVLGIPAFVLFSNAGPLLLAAGEPPALVAGVETYLSVMRWSVPGAMIGIGLMRAFLPAIGGGALLLYVSLAQAVANLFLCYGLIHGAWGLPALGLQGAALASTIVLSLGAASLLALLHASPARRRWVAWSRPDLASLRAMLRLGIPIAAIFAVETGLFFAAALLVGRLGAAPLAAHQVGMSLTSVAFMVPLGIAQAANVRVGYRIGANDRPGARRAGLVAIGIGAVFEALAGLVFLLAPHTIIACYLDPADPAPFAIALQLVRIAAIFAIADGVQCVASGALRGLGDTRAPFLLAAIGYWAIGFPAAWFLTLHTSMGADGAWWGLAAGVGAVAILLSRRFLIAAA